ncbi:hypothetical protein BGX26_012911, partial [Mortierella sp. AD094]
EPPTFYEDMDDHLPTDMDDNDEYDSLSFEDKDMEKDRDKGNSNDHTFMPSLTKPHQQHDDKHNNFNHNHNNNNGHGLYSQEHLDGHQDEHEFCMQPCNITINNINNNGNAKSPNRNNNNNNDCDDTNNITSSHHRRHIDTSHEPTQPETENMVDEISDKDTAMAKQRRRQDRTHNTSGEQIFFYDGPNLMQAKLYSDRERGKCDSVSEDMTGASHQAFPGTATPTTCSHEPRASNANTNHNTAVHNTHVTSAGDSQPISTPKDVQNLEGSKTSKLPSRSRSPTRRISSSRSRSHSRSRPITPQSAVSARSHTRSKSAASEVWSRTMSEALLKKEQMPSSFSISKARPNILTRGFSAESTSTQEMDHRNRDAGGSANGSSGRKATAKERFVAMVTRNSGSSTPPATNTEVVSGTHDGSLPRSFQEGIDDRSSSRLGRSPMLNQTHSGRQGSPSVSRSGFNDQLGTSPTRPADGMMGFPYNNSSLLMSTSRVTSNLRTTRQSKPRPFSVATMEKVLESSGQQDGVEQRQELLRHFTSQDRQDHQTQSSYQHQNSTHAEPASENAATRPRMIGSGSHPLLTTLSSFHDSSVHPTDGNREQGSKGKEIEHDYETNSGIKSFDTKKLPQPILEDLATINGPLHVHEHHIHHHYYCQHYPPLIHPGAGEIEQTEQHYSTVGRRRRPDSTPLIFGSGASQHPRRSSILDVGFSTSPTENGNSFALPLDDSGGVKPLANKKKMSILGTMSMTSSMRKRFFAEQKKEQAQPAGQTHGTHRRLSIPFFSSQPKYEEEPAVMYHKDGPYGPAGATIRARRNQRQIPLAELSDEEDDEFGTGSVPPSENNSNQQRAKFLSRLKKFLLRPSPFAKNSGVSQENSGSTSTTPTDIKSAATVRVSKSRWSRSGNNLPVHFGQDDLDSEHNSSEALPIFPARQRTFRRWTHQDMFEPPTSTLQRRERIDIRTQFQQSSPATQERHTHYQLQHHHHHHHHHDSSSSQEHHHQHHGTTSKQQSEQRPSSQRQMTSSSDMIAAGTTASDGPRSVDSNNRRSAKSPVTSILSSLPVSTMNDKDLSDHDTTPTTCSTSPTVAKPVVTASNHLPSINASAL